MKYSIGYQLPDSYDSTYDICRDYREHISDVYFSWANEPSGRMPLCADDEKSVECARAFQLDELKKIRELGISLTLLLNANCYGQQANSKSFADKTVRLCHYLKDELDISSVTTTSPFVAKTLKKAFGDGINIKSSVNMRVGTTRAIDQLDAWFDGFYITKELNRNMDGIERLSRYCREKGKKVYILANSGCLTECAFQTYHDNLVAHRKYMQMAETDEVFPSPCWEYLHGLPENEALAKILSSNWIRPEDVKHYEPFFDEMKLATRMHDSARRVVSAYVRGKFSGNLMDLFEPSYSTLFRGTVLDNCLVPQDFYEKTTNCGKNCHLCNYCSGVVDIIKCKYN